MYNRFLRLSSPFHGVPDSYYDPPEYDEEITIEEVKFALKCASDPKIRATCDDHPTWDQLTCPFRKVCLGSGKSHKCDVEWIMEKAYDIIEENI